MDLAIAAICIAYQFISTGDSMSHAHHAWINKSPAVLIESSKLAPDCSLAQGRSGVRLRIYARCIGPAYIWTATSDYHTTECYTDLYTWYQRFSGLPSPKNGRNELGQGPSKSWTMGRKITIREHVMSNVRNRAENVPTLRDPATQPYPHCLPLVGRCSA